MSGQWTRIFNTVAVSIGSTVLCRVMVWLGHSYRVKMDMQKTPNTLTDTPGVHTEFFAGGGGGGGDTSQNFNVV